MMICIADSRDMKTARPACCLARANAQSKTPYEKRTGYPTYQLSCKVSRSAPDCLPVSGQLTNQVAFFFFSFARFRTAYSLTIMGMCDDGDDDDDDDAAFSPPPAYPTYYLQRHFQNPIRKVCPGRV